MSVIVALFPLSPVTDDPEISIACQQTNTTKPNAHHRLPMIRREVNGYMASLWQARVNDF